MERSGVDSAPQVWIVEEAEAATCRSSIAALARRNTQRGRAIE
jgi:hypothetical protein